jgi:hypothetical protein
MAASKVLGEETIQGAPQTGNQPENRGQSKNNP